MGSWLDWGAQPRLTACREGLTLCEGFDARLWANLSLGLSGTFWVTEYAAVGILRLVPHQFCVYEVMPFPQSLEPRESPLPAACGGSLLWMGGCCPLVVLGGPAPALTSAGGSDDEKNGLQGPG